MGQEDSSLLEGLRVLRERWWLVLGGIVVTLGATAAIVLSQTKQYSATATVYVPPANLSSLVNPTQSQTITPALQQADTLEFAQSRTVARRVRGVLGLDTTLDDLIAKLTAASVPSTDLINLSVSDPDPTNAARIANTYASQLVSYINQLTLASVSQALAQISARLTNLPAGSPARAQLLQEQNTLTALQALSSGGPVVEDLAEVPSSPSSPKTKRDLIVGGLVGIVLGLALAFLVDLFDRRIKLAEDFERLYGRTPLTSVHMLRGKPESERERHAELEPFRILRDGLAFISLREKVQVVLVTSAVPSEGKTRVATGLARAMATGGRDVALVEVDLHKPTITRVLGLEPYPRGLTNVLADTRAAATAIRKVPDTPGLSVMTSGPLTPNAAELLRSPAMDDVLRELRGDYDFVVLDAPPLLHVSDAQVLMDNVNVDVVLVVARAYVTTREQARSARAVLDRHPEASVGLVINGIRDAAGYYYYAEGARGESRGPRIGGRRKEKVG